jgi:hypothetical protein
LISYSVSCLQNICSEKTISAFTIEIFARNKSADSENWRTGVQHYVYACTDYAVKDAGWDETYHWGHNDAKGRVGEFILAQGQEGMKSSLLTTGPYMEMLFDGMFVPEEDSDGSFVWSNPASK